MSRPTSFKALCEQVFNVVMYAAPITLFGFMLVAALLEWHMPFWLFSVIPTLATLYMIVLAIDMLPELSAARQSHGIGNTIALWLFMGNAGVSFGIIFLSMIMSGFVTSLLWWIPVAVATVCAVLIGLLLYIG